MNEYTLNTAVTLDDGRNIDVFKASKFNGLTQKAPFGIVKRFEDNSLAKWPRNGANYATLEEALFILEKDCNPNTDNVIVESEGLAVDLSLVDSVKVWLENSTEIDAENQLVSMVNETVVKVLKASGRYDKDFFESLEITVQTENIDGKNEFSLSLDAWLDVHHNVTVTYLEGIDSNFITLVETKLSPACSMSKLASKLLTTDLAAKVLDVLKEAHEAKMLLISEKEAE